MIFFLKLIICNIDIQSNKRKYAFTLRVSRRWNKLTDTVVNAPTLNTFKNRLDRYWKNRKFIAKLRKQMLENFIIWCGIIISMTWTNLRFSAELYLKHLKYETMKFVFIYFNFEISSVHAHFRVGQRTMFVNERYSTNILFLYLFTNGLSITMQYTMNNFV
jgi:hypothetical protein